MSQKKEELMTRCYACLGTWGCNMCGKEITSHSKVVRNFTVVEDGEKVNCNFFFCTRRCFKDFKDYHSSYASSYAKATADRSGKSDE